ncbi:RRQRL motif-containing zinc-binding protein [Nocardia sp. CA-120079]|uniref:RRQRL motif-containing zinc-binding protein n=1 Tax=Nocardia sp. CA-120079 TaxID=3239974 RepID=UPI003D96DC25
MTTSTDAQQGGIPTYQWRCAPSHLRTLRQLASQGLRPNGQDIAGKLPLPKQKDRVAYLYDINQAAPKRVFTPARQAALAKANRERLLRAAERHGFSRAEFEQVGDPGPQWDDREWDR